MTLEHTLQDHSVTTRRQTLERNLHGAISTDLVWEAWTASPEMDVLRDHLLATEQIPTPDRWLTAQVAIACGHDPEDEALFTLEQSVRRWILKRMASDAEMYTLTHLENWPDVLFAVTWKKVDPKVDDLAVLSDALQEQGLRTPGQYRSRRYRVGYGNSYPRTAADPRPFAPEYVALTTDNELQPRLLRP